MICFEKGKLTQLNSLPQPTECWKQNTAEPEHGLRDFKYQDFTYLKATPVYSAFLQPTKKRKKKPLQSITFPFLLHLASFQETGYN